MYKFNDENLCTSKTKEIYKVKNLIKNTPFMLHNIHQHRGALRTPPSLQDGDFCKNSQGLSVINYFSKKFCLRSLTGFLLHVIKE